MLQRRAQRLLNLLAAAFRPPSQRLDELGLRRVFQQPLESCAHANGSWNDWDGRSSVQWAHVLHKARQQS